MLNGFVSYNTHKISSKWNHALHITPVKKNLYSWSSWFLQAVSVNTILTYHHRTKLIWWTCSVNICLFTLLHVVSQCKQLPVYAVTLHVAVISIHSPEHLLNLSWSTCSYIHPTDTEQRWHSFGVMFMVTWQMWVQYVLSFLTLILVSTASWSKFTSLQLLNAPL